MNEQSPFIKLETKIKLLVEELKRAKIPTNPPSPQSMETSNKLARIEEIVSGMVKLVDEF